MPNLYEMKEHVEILLDLIALFFEKRKSRV